MLMVVDDDPSFLAQAQELLDPGRGVFLAADAPHARALIDTLGDNLTVAMVDLDLPGEDGFTLIRDLRARSPHLTIVAISGVCQANVLESAKAIGASATLAKPITPAWNAALAEFRSAA